MNLELRNVGSLELNLPQPEGACQDGGMIREVAFRVREGIIRLRRDITIRFLALGALLDVVHRHRLWQGFADSFAEFCMDPEVEIKPSTAYRLIRIYRTAKKLDLVTHPLLQKAGVRRAYYVLGASTDREDAIHKLEEAVLLPATEVELLYKGDDPQTAAIENLLARFCTLNGPSRLMFMTRAYLILTPDQRADLWREIEDARQKLSQVPRTSVRGFRCRDIL